MNLPFLFSMTSKSYRKEKSLPAMLTSTFHIYVKRFQDDKTIDIILEKYVEGSEGPNIMLTFQLTEYLFTVKRMALEELNINMKGKIIKDILPRNNHLKPNGRGTITNFCRILQPYYWWGEVVLNTPPYRKLALGPM